MESRQKTVLIIQNNHEMRRRLEHSLLGSPYQIVTASRALEGLDVARHLVPDMVLTDLDLPDLNGRELATMLRIDPRFRDSAIVALCRNASQDERELGFAAGINGFIEESTQLETLSVWVDFYMSGGTDGIVDTEQLAAAQDRFLQDLLGRLERRVRDLESKNEALERADKMKDSFIQLTAHELRTPLTLITGYSRLIEDYPSLRGLIQSDQELRQLVGGLSESIGRMQSIIEQILTITRIMTRQIELNLRPLVIAKVLANVIQQYESALRDRQLRLLFDPLQWPQQIIADEALLRITLDNLLSNAIKYTPNGGHVSIQGRVEGNMLRITFKDSGIGIARELQEQIFERMHIGGNVDLHTTSKTAFGGGGLGLGLAICRGIVESHGGTIWVESAGRDEERLPGSEFIVMLPLAPRNVTAPVTTSRIKPLPARSSG